MIDKSVNSDFNVPSHVKEDSIVEGMPSENRDSESDSDIWEVIEKGSEKGKPKLVNSSGYSYVVRRVRNGTKYWRCSVRNSNMKCPATVTERCGVFTSSQASHCHSPVTGASVLTKLKVAFKGKAQSDPFTASPMIVDEAIYHHMDPTYACDLPNLRSLYRTVNRVRQALRHNHQENLNSVSESDSDVWEVIKKGSQMGRPKLVNNSGYSYVVSRVRNGTKYWRCSVRNSNMKCPATVTERCGVFTSSQAPHCHSPVAGASVLTKLKVAFKEKAYSDPFTASPMIVDDAIYNHVVPTDLCDLPNLRSLYRMANRVGKAVRHNHQENLKFDLNLDALPEDFVQA